MLNNKKAPPQRWSQINITKLKPKLGLSNLLITINDVDNSQNSQSY